MVKEVAQTKLSGAGDEQKAAGIKSDLAAAEAEVTKQRADLKRQASQYNKLKSKVSVLLSAKGALQRRLPAAKGEVNSAVKVVDARKAAKAQAKAKALQALFLAHLSLDIDENIYCAIKLDDHPLLGCCCQRFAK